MNKLSNYYFCVDGGGTKALANLYDSNEKIISSSKTDAGNIYNDVCEVEKNISILWSDCCKKAKLNKNLICKKTIASFGLAGGRSIKNKNLIKKKFNIFKKIIISTDGHIALAGTSMKESMAVLNIGTGVVAHLMLTNKFSQQISGWGYPYGDKAGGWWIGLSLITETLKSLDGYKDNKDYIIKKVLKEIGTNDLKILNWLSNASPKDLAKLANILFAAKKKSKIANKILNEAINEIEKILEYILAKKIIKKIYFTGGLSNLYAPYIKSKFAKYLIYNSVNPLLGALLISKKKFPIEKLINNKRIYL
jgi:glucosamine kinase